MIRDCSVLILRVVNTYYGWQARKVRFSILLGFGFVFLPFDLCINLESLFKTHEARCVFFVKFTFFIPAAHKQVTFSWDDNYAVGIRLEVSFLLYPVNLASIFVFKPLIFPVPEIPDCAHYENLHLISRPFERFKRGLFAIHFAHTLVYFIHQLLKALL